MQSTRASSKFTLRENLILIGSILGVFLIIFLVSYLRNYSQEIHPIRKKPSAKAVEYLENVYSRDNKYTFVVHATASTEFAEFLQLYANGYLEKAAEKMKKLAKTEDDSKVLSACYNNLGNIADDLSEYRRAIAYYDEGISVENKNGYLWFNKAIAQYHENEVKASLESFLIALKLNNGFDKALLNIGNIYFELNDYNKAYDYFKKVPRNSPLYRQSRYNIAIVIKAIDPDSKGNGLTDILRGLTTKNDEIAFLASLNLGNTYFTKGDFYQAREYYQNACSINTNNFIAFYNLALLEKQQKNYDDAIKHFEKAIRNRKSFNPALRQLGELYYIKSDVTKGLLALEQFALSTNDVSAQMILADLYYEKGPESYAFAADLYNEIIQKTAGADSKIANVNIGNIQYYYTNYPAAIKYYELALKIDPEDDKIFYNLGMTYARMNSFDEAIINFQKSLTINPKNDKTAMALILLYDRRNLPEKAMSLCRDLIFRSSAPPVFQYLLASLLIKHGRTGEAQKALSHIDSSDPQLIAGVALLNGIILDKNGDYQKAIYEYDRSLAARTNNLKALFNKGVAQYKLAKTTFPAPHINDFKDAIATFFKVTIITDDPFLVGMAYLNLGNIYYRCHDFTQAQEQYQKAMEYIPDSTAASFNIQKTGKELRKNR